MSTSLRRDLPFSIVTGCLCLLAGCQSLDLKRPGVAPRLPQASEKNPVVEVLCLWEPAEGTGLDKLPARGFAGQILFMTPRDKEPVQVEGKLRIYVFDDYGTIEEQQQPIHQFTFDSTSWNAFLRETNLGAAYQLFIPYTRPGMHAAVCSLRVCYESPDGEKIYSRFAKVTLPGKPAAATMLPGDGLRETELPGGVQSGAVTRDKAVVPAAYTITDSEKSDASIRQLQARFDKLLEHGGGGATVAGAPHGDHEAPTGRLRLKPAETTASALPDEE